jgi:hypothetical protein
MRSSCNVNDAARGFRQQPDRKGKNLHATVVTARGETQAGARQTNVSTHN